MNRFNHSSGLTYQQVIAFFLVVCLLVSCSAADGLPAEAQKTVEDTAQAYYNSPWLGGNHFAEVSGIKITRAWRAKDANMESNSGEMWCVDVAVSGKQGGSPKDISAVWIVVRENAQGKWQAVALETISASTTIERCGK